MQSPSRLVRFRPSDMLFESAWRHTSSNRDRYKGKTRPWQIHNRAHSLGNRAPYRKKIPSCKIWKQTSVSRLWIGTCHIKIRVYRFGLSRALGKRHLLTQIESIAMNGNGEDKFDGYCTEHIIKVMEKLGLIVHPSHRTKRKMYSYIYVSQSNFPPPTPPTPGFPFSCTSLVEIRPWRPWKYLCTVLRTYLKKRRKRKEIVTAVLHNHEG